MKYFIIFLLVLVFVLLIIAYILFSQITKRKKSPNSNSALNKLLPKFLLDEKFLEKYVDWMKSLKYDYLTIKSFDNLDLHGCIIENAQPTDKWVIICHGYTGGINQSLVFAKKCYDLGFNILMPEARGHGESEGNSFGMGWLDRLDIIDWIKYLVNNDSNSKIILYGISMGASSILMTLGETLPKNIKLVISDCAYSSANDEIKFLLKNVYHVPIFTLKLSSLMAKIRLGYSFEEADAIKQVSKTNIPILYIHGNADKITPVETIDKLYDNTKSIKEKLVIENAGHAESIFIDENLYWNTIKNFIAKNMQ